MSRRASLERPHNSTSTLECCPPFVEVPLVTLFARGRVSVRVDRPATKGRDRFDRRPPLRSSRYPVSVYTSGEGVSSEKTEDLNLLEVWSQRVSWTGEDGLVGRSPEKPLLDLTILSGDASTTDGVSSPCYLQSTYLLPSFLIYSTFTGELNTSQRLFIFFS